MRQECLSAVGQALGRDPTQAEARNIEQRVADHMRRLAREDPGKWRGMGAEERLKAAADAAAKELTSEFALKKARLQKQTIALDQLNNRLADQVAQGADPNRMEALKRVLVGKNDFQNNGTPVEHAIKARVKADMMQLAEAVEALKPGLWSALPFSNPVVERQFVEALAGVADPNRPKEMDAAAKAFREVAAKNREEFNSEGGQIGRLENYDFPHAWADWIALKAGQEKFVADFMGYVDRSKYVHEDGRLFNDEEMQAFLGEAWKTIASNGLSKENTGPQFPGGAVKANRHRQHRALHLRPDKTFDAYKAYMRGNALELIVGHVRQMARDIELVKTFGPNSDHTIQTLIDKIVQEEAALDPGAASRVQGAARWAQNYYDYLAGNNPPAANRGLADTMSMVRSWQTVAKLGGASVAAFVQDPVFMHLAADQNRLNHFKLMLNQAIAFSPKGRRFVRRIGLMTDAMIGTAERFAQDNLNGRELGQRVAGEYLRLTGLNFVTEMRRTAFGVTMMDAIGHLTRRYQDVAKLKADDQRALAAHNIDQQTWDIWRAAKLEGFGVHGKLLTPDAILQADGFDDAAKQAAMLKLLAVISEETDVAIIQPGARERVQLTAGTQAGTGAGEIVRSMILFKSFPYAVIKRPLERALNGYGGVRRYGAVASMLVFTTMAGILTNWVRDLLNGKDPRTINPTSEIGFKNVMSGALTGGALGLYSDFLFAESRPGGNGLIDTLAGPIAGDAASLWTNTYGAARDMAQQSLTGEDVDSPFEPSFVNAVRGMVPGQNFWVTKAASDRILFNQLQEMLDPGYLDRMQARQESQRGTSYWWEPDEMTPERAPDLEAAFAEP